MTIDERIEALTMNLELLSRDREEDRKADRERIAEQKKRDIQLDALHSEMMLAMARLAHIAEAHNGQLADHQDRIDRLEGR